MIPKFRGRSISEENKGQWVYGNLIVDGGCAYIVNGVIECNDQYITIAEWCPVEPKTVGAFIGLFDKSGVEIFEGDVVAYFDDNEQASENVTIRYGKHIDEASVFKEKPRHIGFYIEATKGTATFDVINMYEEFKENIKVIGNIHEHPELVEGRDGLD